MRAVGCHEVNNVLCVTPCVIDVYLKPTELRALPNSGTLINEHSKLHFLWVVPLNGTPLAPLVCMCMMKKKKNLGYILLATNVPF